MARPDHNTLWRFWRAHRDDMRHLFVTDTGSYRVQVYQKEVIHLEPHQIAPPMRSVTLHQE